MTTASIQNNYQAATERYASLGVDTGKALQILQTIPLSLHCWQGDDVTGFEQQGGDMGGIMATGNYPGKARNPSELRADISKALELIPGKHRVNLHAIYAEQKNKADRNELTVEHFSNWIGWAKQNKLGLDFNGTFFAHPKAANGRTLSHQDQAIRRFWVEHGQACRKIGALMGEQLGSPCVTNIWVPDGSKDVPVDRKTPRELLTLSLDEIFAEDLNPNHNLDAVEGKLFGLGSEAYVVGSYDFYLAYAVARNKMLCLDTGHFHPTESVADKLSSVLLQLNKVLLHVSRGLRWDSDHVVVLSDDIRSLCEELIRGNYLEKTTIGLDFFDASINRVAAWVIGSRAALKALLIALLEPEYLRELEQNEDFTARLALMEDLKSLPFGAVWDFYCLQKDVPLDTLWINEVRQYEKTVQALR